MTQSRNHIKDPLSTSRFDWGDSFRSLTSSLTWSNKADNAMANAAAAAKRSLDDEGGFDPRSPFAGNGGGTSKAEVEEYRSSRYDPKSMNRLGDLNDLVDIGESMATEGEEEFVDAGSGAERLSGLSGYRQAMLMVACVGIIAGGSLGISAILTNSETAVSAGGEPQRLLEIAESVVAACSESRVTEDASDCQQLCRDHLCCFDDVFECGEDHKEGDCVVYVGCEALMMYPTNKGSKWGRS